MQDGEPNTPVPTGTETDKPVETTDGDSDKGKELNPILAEAKSLAERIEEGNKKSEDLLTKMEKLLAEQALGGTAGGRVETKPAVETDKEYSERIEKELKEGKHND